ncbi:VanZ family protein [Demequina salsinemoris]|uniref:VanZ family protein n=1 Tax=Demequina salsinemoris TaxID=577470 RepID=UPI0007801F17|nr:VanZ family protein [Demequina salsinemoris]
MFDTWASPAFAAIITGGALWGVILAPLLLYQIRAYGGLSLTRAGGAAAVSIYGVALVAYTLLPTPGTDSWCASDRGGTMELDVFHSIDDIRWAVAHYGMPDALLSFTVLQVAMNVVLFIPWGILARRYFNMPFVLAVLSGVFASLAIELTQYSGGWSLVGCQYRVADIDDLLANSLGALIGAIIAPLLLFWMPPASRLTEGRLRPRPVLGLRRGASVVLDLAILWATALLSFQVIDLVAPAGGTDADSASRHAFAFAIGGLVVLVPSVVRGGPSWGERIVWLRPAGRWGGDVSRARIVLRGFAGLGVYATLCAVGSGLEGASGVSPYLVILGHAFAATLVLWAAIDPRGGLPDLLVGAAMVDERGTAEPDLAEDDVMPEA